MIAFILTGHFFPQPASAMSLHILAYDIFPLFPGFCLADVVLTQCNHISTWPQCHRVVSPCLIKVLVWVLSLHTTTFPTKLQKLKVFEVSLTLFSSGFTQMKIFDRPCNHAQHCPEKPNWDVTFPPDLGVDIMCCNYKLKASGLPLHLASARNCCYGELDQQCRLTRDTTSAMKAGCYFHISASLLWYFILFREIQII